MDITITIPDGVKDRVLDAFAASYNYSETLDDGEGNLTPNPQSKAVFAKGKVRDYIKDVVKGYEAKTAAESARVAAIVATDEDILLT